MTCWSSFPIDQANPALVEARQLRLAVQRLIAGLDLPDGDEVLSPVQVPQPIDSYMLTVPLTNKMRLL